MKDNLVVLSLFLPKNKNKKHSHISLVNLVARKIYKCFDKNQN